MAQPKPNKRVEQYNPETRAMMRVDKLSKSVTLTETQKKEVLALFVKQEQGRQTIQQAKSEERENQQAQCQADREKNAEALKSIIGEDNYKQYQESNKREHRAKPDAVGNKKDCKKACSK